MDHAARAEEEQRLEERVRHQVEDARAERADAAGQKHVAELADRGVGENFLDVGLHQADGGGEKAPSAQPITATAVMATGACRNSTCERATM